MHGAAAIHRSVFRMLANFHEFSVHCMDLGNDRFVALSWSKNSSGIVSMSESKWKQRAEKRSSSSAGNDRCKGKTGHLR